MNNSQYIIIIFLTIIIIYFTSKINTYYKKETLINSSCGFNCGYYRSEEDCLGCRNCGVCTLTEKNRIYHSCLNGDKNGAYFNNSCRGSNWKYGNVTPAPPTLRGYDISQNTIQNLPLYSTSYRVTEDNVQGQPRIIINRPTVNYDDILGEVRYNATRNKEYQYKDIQNTNYEYVLSQMDQLTQNINI
jgi:hypothetical protein